MSISLLDNLSIRKKSPNVDRDLFNTIADMVAYSENYLPDVFECNVVEDGNRYRYNRGNTIDPTLGKWRLVEAGGAQSLIDYYKKTETEALLEGYVKKDPNKGLSTHDFTEADKQKLDNLENYDDSAVQTHIQQSEQSIRDIQAVIGNAPLNTTAQTHSEAINELKANAEGSIEDLQEQITKNTDKIQVLNGDKTVTGSVDSKVATSFEESKAYTDEQIEKMASNQAIVCDSKPIYSAGVTSYVKDGATLTTEEENIWFYYQLDGKLMQTIWITGEEITIVSAGAVNFNDLVSKTNDVTSDYTGDEANTDKIPDLLAMKKMENKLKNEVDQRVKGTDIYDGLDSNSVTSPLSANQGRVLDEKVNTKIDKVFTGDNVANKPLRTDSMGNIVLGEYDSDIDGTSENAVKNKAVKVALDKKLDIVQSVDKKGCVPMVDENGNFTLIQPTALGGTAEATSYQNDTYPELTNVDLALDKIFAKLYYVEPKITSFVMTPSTDTYEIGTVIPADTLKFTWTINKDITSQSLTDCTIEVADREAIYGSEITNTKTITLTVSDGENNVSANKRISFLNKIYWGNSVEPTEINSDFILSLSNNKLSGTSKQDYSFNVGAGEYGYFAVPTSMKFTSIWVNGFQADVQEVATISFTNGSGYTSTYVVLRTAQSSLGSFVATVK